MLLVGKALGRGEQTESSLYSKDFTHIFRVVEKEKIGINLKHFTTKTRTTAWMQEVEQCRSNCREHEGSTSFFVFFVSSW